MVRQKPNRILEALFSDFRLLAITLIVLVSLGQTIEGSVDESGYFGGVNGYPIESLEPHHWSDWNKRASGYNMWRKGKRADILQSEPVLEYDYWIDEPALAGDTNVKTAGLKRSYSQWRKGKKSYKDWRKGKRAYQAWITPGKKVPLDGEATQDRARRTGAFGFKQWRKTG